MRFILLAAFLSAVLLSAPAHARLPVVQENETRVDRLARKGDPGAQFDLGMYYCSVEPAKAQGARTVEWWSKAAASKNSFYAMHAMQELGNFYLSLYDDLFDYDPAKKSRPVRYCTGSTHSAANTAKAAAWLTKCANHMDSWEADCDLALGHLNQHDRKYAQAYYWYARGIVANAVQYPPGGSEFKGPLLNAPHRAYSPKEAGDKRFAYARLAARHLNKKEIAVIDAQARQWYASLSRSIGADYDRRSARERYND